MQHSEIYKQLFDFMVGIINGDEQIIDGINEENTELIYENQRLIFMINGLYTHLLMGKPIEGNIDYVTFRHMLYHSDLNARLTDKGYMVSVYPVAGSPTAKVDANWYILQPLQSY